MILLRRDNDYCLHSKHIVSGILLLTFTSILLRLVTLWQKTIPRLFGGLFFNTIRDLNSPNAKRQKQSGGLFRWARACRRAQKRAEQIPSSAPKTALLCEKQSGVFYAFLSENSAKAEICCQLLPKSFIFRARAMPAARRRGRRGRCCESVCPP